MASPWLDKLDSSWLTWLTALYRVDPARREERNVCGHWSVKDLVGHMALWDAEVLTDIQCWQLDVPRRANDWQRMNDDDHARKLHVPYDLLRVEMFLVHQAARDAIERLPAELPEDMIDAIGVDTWDHYEDHTQHVVAWLQT